MVNRHALLCGALALLLALGFSAQPTLGAAQHRCNEIQVAGFGTGPGDANGDTPITRHFAVGQTFLSLQTVTLSRVSLVAQNAGATAPLTLTVATDGGARPGAALASTTVTPLNTDPDLVQFRFEPGVVLQEGVSYYLVASMETPGGAYIWLRNGNNPYPDGAGYHSVAAAVMDWTQIDQLFAVWGCPASSPD